MYKGTKATKSLTENQLAVRWNISIKTLQDWRRKGVGVKYLKIGKAVRYPIEVVEQFEADNMTGGGQ